MAKNPTDNSDTNQAGEAWNGMFNSILRPLMWFRFFGLENLKKGANEGIQNVSDREKTKPEKRGQNIPMESAANHNVSSEVEQERLQDHSVNLDDDTLFDDLSENVQVQREQAQQEAEQERLRELAAARVTQARQAAEAHGRLQQQAQREEVEQAQQEAEQERLRELAAARVRQARQGAEVRGLQQQAQREEAEQAQREEAEQVLAQKIAFQNDLVAFKVQLKTANVNSLPQLRRDAENLIQRLNRLEMPHKQDNLDCLQQVKSYSAFKGRGRAIALNNLFRIAEQLFVNIDSSHRNSSRM